LPHKKTTKKKQLKFSIFIVLLVNIVIRFSRGRTNRKREIEVPVRREESTSEEVIGGAAFLLGRGIFTNCAIKHCQIFERRNGIDSKKKIEKVNPIHGG